MTKPDKWYDPTFIRVWDARPATPLRAEQLDILATVIRDNYRKGGRILDLGCGTGRVEQLILDLLPVARFTSVDRSPAMLDMVRRRLIEYGAQCRLVQCDLNRLSTTDLPDRPFQFIVSVNMIHELPHPAKCRLFRLCRRVISRTGLLLIVDRIALDRRSLSRPYRSALARLQRIAHTESGEYSSQWANPRTKDDEHPATLDEYFRWLRAAGFVPGLLHLHCHKALLVASPL